MARFGQGLIQGLTNPQFQQGLFELGDRIADRRRETKQLQSISNITSLSNQGMAAAQDADLGGLNASIKALQQQVASASIAEQERKNKLLVAKGEQMKAKGEFDLQRMQQKGAFDVDMLQRRGQASADALENQRTESLLGLASDNLRAANEARAQARSQFFSGLGNAAAGVAGLYAPGGTLYGK